MDYGPIRFAYEDRNRAALDKLIASHALTLGDNRAHQQRSQLCELRRARGGQQGEQPLRCRRRARDGKLNRTGRGRKLNETTQIAQLPKDWVSSADNMYCMP